MHKSITIANRFLALAKEQGDTLTPMQLLKLVYIAHGWMLGIYGRPLIDEDVEAWPYGPVLPDLYEAIREFRSQPVKGPLPVRGDTALTADEERVISRVYALYGKESGPALSRLTHRMGSPWAQTYKHGVFGATISNDLIEDHYQHLAKKRA